VYELTKDKYQDEDGNDVNIRLTQYPFGLKAGSQKAKYTAWHNVLDPDNQIINKKGEGNVTKLLGSACFVNIEHNQKDDKTYANIAGLSQLPEDYPVGDPQSDLYFFDSLNPDPAIAATLSDYIKDHIRGSIDYVGSDLEKVIEGQVTERAEDNTDVDTEEEEEGYGEDSPV
jgi:hypothetical protein